MTKVKISVEELTLLQIGMADIECSATTERHELDTAPILSIPNEITLVIFNFACHSPPLFLRDCIAGHHSGESSKCEEATALVISRVCHPWRRISLACPELWTTFNDTRKRYNAMTLKYRIATHMERSNRKLLDIRVCLSADDKGAIFNILASPHYMCRWRRISLCGGKVQGKDAFYPIVSKDRTPKYRNLKTLEINQLEENFYSLLQQMFNSQELESLRIPKLSWYHISSLRSLSVLQIVGHISTSVTVHFMYMLMALPNLKVLSITNPDKSSSVTTGYESYHEGFGMCLTSRTLVYIRCSHYPMATMMLRAPQLKCIIFDGLSNLHFLNHPSSNDSRSPPFPSLHILALVGCVALPREFASIEGKFPGISQLIISQIFSILPRNRAPDFYTNHILMNMKAWGPGSTTVSRMHMLCMGSHRQDTKLQMHSISRAVRLLRRHKKILGSTWRLCIEPGFSRIWQALDPELWKSAQNEGLFEDTLDECFSFQHAGETDYPWTYEARYNDGSCSPYINGYTFEL